MGKVEGQALFDRRFAAPKAVRCISARYFFFVGGIVFRQNGDYDTGENRAHLRRTKKNRFFCIFTALNKSFTKYLLQQWSN